MIEFEELEINIPSGKIAAIACGPKSGKPILAAHGWLDNAASFIPIAKYLPGFRLVAIDFPGHGLSDHKPQKSYMHFVDYIPDVVHVLDKLGWDKFSLLGHSLGAAILTLIAGIYPEKIECLGLIDAIGPYHASSDHLPDVMHQAIENYKRLHKKQLPAYDSIEIAMQKRLLASPMKKSSVKHLLDRGLKLGKDNKYHWRTDPRLVGKSLIMFSEEQVDVFLQRVTAPTCFVRSNNGWPFTEESYNRRIKLIKDLTIHRVEGGHHLHMDKADIVGDIFYKFFK